MNIQTLAALAQIAEKLAASPATAELRNSAAFQQFEKQMTPMKDDVLKSLTDLMASGFPGTILQKAEEKPTADAVVGLDAMIVQYEALINHHFKHAKGDTYCLINIANAASEDQVKFPTSAVYVSLTTNEVWSRPLVEFATKFVKI